MDLHEQDLREKTVRWRGRSKQRQQHQDWSVNKYLALTAPSSNFVPFIGLNVIPTTRVLQKRSRLDTKLSDGPDSATEVFNKSSMFPVEQPEKRYSMAASCGATHPSVKLILAPPQNAKPGHCNKLLASSSSETGLFDDVKFDVLPVWFTGKAFFEDGFSLD